MRLPLGLLDGFYRIISGWRAPPHQVTILIMNMTQKPLQDSGSLISATAPENGTFGSIFQYSSHALARKKGCLQLPRFGCPVGCRNFGRQFAQELTGKGSRTFMSSLFTALRSQPTPPPNSANATLRGNLCSPDTERSSDPLYLCQELQGTV